MTGSRQETKSPEDSRKRGVIQLGLVPKYETRLEAEIVDSRGLKTPNPEKSGKKSLSDRIKSGEIAEKPILSDSKSPREYPDDWNLGRNVEKEYLKEIRRVRAFAENSKPKRHETSSRKLDVPYLEALIRFLGTVREQEPGPIVFRCSAIDPNPIRFLNHLKTALDIAGLGWANLNSSQTKFCINGAQENILLKNQRLTK